jgi:hypothetical protein
MRGAGGGGEDKAGRKKFKEIEGKAKVEVGSSRKKINVRETNRTASQ